MKKRNWLVLACFILCTVLSSQTGAQQNGEIKGTVIERTSSDPLEAATVRLLLSDNTMTVAVATEDDGSFVLSDIPSGEYLLSVTYTGFEPVYQSVQLDSRTASVNIGTVAMEEDIVELDEIVVTANYPTFNGLSNLLVFNTGLFDGLDKFTAELPEKFVSEVVENRSEPVIFIRTYRHRRFN